MYQGSGFPAFRTQFLLSFGETGFEKLGIQTHVSDTHSYMWLKMMPISCFCYILFSFSHATAMPAGDDLERYMSSLSLRLEVIKPSSNVQPSDAPLPEDAAWADSLLIEDLETSESTWNFLYSLSDPLSENLTAEHASLLAAMEDDSPPVDDFQVSVPLLSPESLSTTSLDDTVLVNGEADSDNELLGSNEENTDVLWSKRKLKNAFRPTYNEDLRPSSGAAHAEDDELFRSSFVMEQPIGDIFQVWDLGFETEEDEWIKQLNKALDESSPEASASTFSKDVIDIKIDDIISGMEDLSLNRFL